jgi:hypothetical protein
MKNHHSPFRLTILLGAGVGLILVSLLLGLVWPPLSSAGQSLPPRETPTATPASKEKDKSDKKPIGAYIALQVQPAQAGLWSVVQWQDSAGGWHEVEGWRATLGAGGSIHWWVAAKDFGTGPFRWNITEGPGGRVLGTSQTFNLPAQANETLRVTVFLTQ